MATINLLPWREENRKEQLHQFYMMLVASALVALVIVAITHLCYAHWTSEQKSANRYLGEEISKLEKEIKEIETLRSEKQKLLERIEMIERLQADRPLIVRLFDEIVRVLPSGLYIDSLTKKKEIISMVGHAESNTRVSTLMRNIEQSPWLSEPDLQFIRIDDDASDLVKEFELEFAQEEPDKV